jgi:hypothetical protein
MPEQQCREHQRVRYPEQIRIAGHGHAGQICDDCHRTSDHPGDDDQNPVGRAGAGKKDRSAPCREPPDEARDSDEERQSGRDQEQTCGEYLPPRTLVGEVGHPCRIVCVALGRAEQRDAGHHEQDVENGRDARRASGRGGGLGSGSQSRKGGQNSSSSH